MNHSIVCFLTSFLLVSSAAGSSSSVSKPVPLYYGSGDALSSAKNEYSEEDKVVSSGEETNAEEFISSDFTITTKLVKTMSFNPAFTENYFSHLDNHLLANTADNCGYVAMGMLLGFYDNYASDNYLPENYDLPSVVSSLNDSQTDWSSPGVIDTGITAEPEIEIESKGFHLKTYIMEPYLNEVLTGDTLLSNLYQIAINHNFLSTTSTSAALTAEEIKAILSDYLKVDTLAIAPKRYVYEKIYNVSAPKSSTIYSNSLTKIRSEIVQTIQQGIPVICGGKVKETQSGHIVVAYDYDSTNDIIYGNLGYKGSGLTHVNLDSYFSSIDCLLSIVNRDKQYHSHNDNYHAASGNISYCSCELSSHDCGLEEGQESNCYCRCPSTHGTHSFSSVSTYNSTYHKRSCSCGRFWTEKHTFNFDHRCNTCGFVFNPQGGSSK